MHFAYTSNNMTDNATGKNLMSKTLSLQIFLSDARQLLGISSTSQFDKKRNEIYQLYNLSKEAFSANI